MAADYGKDLYSDSEPSTQDRMAPEHEAGMEDEGEHKDSGKTALINSDICPDMKPGDEMVLRIERVMDGQYECSYSPEPSHKGEGGDGEGEAVMPKAGRDEALHSMME